MFFDGYIYIYIYTYIDSLVGIVFKDTYPHTCRHTDYAVNEGRNDWCEILDEALAQPKTERVAPHDMYCILLLCQDFSNRNIGIYGQVAWFKSWVWGTIPKSWFSDPFCKILQSMVSQKNPQSNCEEPMTGLPHQAV